MFTVHDYPLKYKFHELTYLEALPKDSAENVQS